ncbi:MAG: NAD-dependent epimerase/dehydratase family protein [Acidobacteriaceae bacterium]
MSTLLNVTIAEDLASIVNSPLPWHELSGATILVSGAAGFLPAYMVETILFLNDHILEKPAQVIGLVRNIDRARERFAAYLERNDFALVVQNVSDPLTIPANFDYIIHAASQASPVYYRTDPAGTLSSNVLGTYHLLRAAQQHPVRGFLFFSSGEVYGLVNDGSRPIAEHDGGFSDPTDLRACYCESKRMGETMCVAWAHQYSVPTRIARPFHTYGPGMRLDDGRVFADFVRDILKGGPIILQSDGTARRSFCYLADATLGFFNVLFNGGNGEAYNVANPGGECSIAELADRLAVTFNREGITVARRARVDANYSPSTIVSTVPDISKLKALGWTPTTTIEAGFRRTVESYRSPTIPS